MSTPKPYKFLDDDEVNLTFMVREGISFLILPNYQIISILILMTGLRTFIFPSELFNVIKRKTKPLIPYILKR